MRIRCLIPLLLASVMVLTSMSQCRKEDPGQASNRVQARIDGVMYGRGNESYTSGRRPVLTGSEEGFNFHLSTTLLPAGVEDSDELRNRSVTLVLHVRENSAVELNRPYTLDGSGDYIGQINKTVWEEDEFGSSGRNCDFVSTEGSVVFTARSERSVSGTFEFTAVRADTGDAVKVEDGVFENLLILQ